MLTFRVEEGDYFPPVSLPVPVLVHQMVKLMAPGLQLCRGKVSVRVRDVLLSGQLAVRILVILQQVLVLVLVLSLIHI